MNYTSLVNELKNKVAITWDDLETETKLLSIVEDAKISLDFILGITFDYTIAGMEHNLFLNYCMYDYNNCLYEFEKNYLRQIILIKSKHEVERRLNDKAKI